MCGMCGPAPTSPGWFDAGVPDDLGSRLRARDTILRVAGAVLDPRAVGVGPVPGSASIAVSSRDGRSRPVDDFGALWSTIDALTGHVVDPLGRS